MTQIVLDAALSTRLEKFMQSVELCNPTGQVIGKFVPAYPPDCREPQISKEELARRKREEKGGRTLAEIMADLEKHA